MSWVKYPKINHASRFFLKHPSNNRYVGIEKFHGTNFSIHVTKDKKEYYKRNGPIEGKFYDYKSVIEPYNKDLELLYQKLGDYIIYGELYGKGVQKEIHYGDEKYFVPFDIYTTHFLSYNKLCDVLKDTSFKVLQPLVVGTLEECFLFDVDKINNIEGIVVRPMTQDGDERYKCKTKQFNESRGVKHRKIKQMSFETKEEEDYYNYLIDNITENRISNVLSKEEEEFACVKNLSRIVPKLMNDIPPNHDIVISDDKKNKMIKLANSVAFKLTKEVLLKI